MKLGDTSGGALNTGEPLRNDAVASYRRARRTDLPLLAEVLEMAGRGHLELGPWDLIFPRHDERRRALAHIAGDAPASWCHQSLFHVAELDGEPAAALVAFDARDFGDTSLAAPLFETFALLGWPAERMEAVAPMLAPYLACFPDMPPGVWIVENVGTRAPFRRHGLVRGLLDRALAEGRRRGCRSAQISCLIGNDAAQRAYERAGFEVVEELRSAEFDALVGAPGFSRMTRALTEEEA